MILLCEKGVENNMEKYCKSHIDTEISNVVKKIEIRNKELKELKEKLENYFKFEITDYIIGDILDCENYNHVCLMINLAVINNRISLENSITLKNKLKKLFQINDMFDKLNKDNYIPENAITDLDN